MDPHYRFHLELTPAQLRVTHSALRSFMDDFGHDEHDVHAVVREVLDKLPSEQELRGVEITPEA